MKYQSNIAKKSPSFLLKKYRPFKYDGSEQLMKILYDFINMHGINGKNCANLITDPQVFAIFMSEKPFDMKNRQVELTRNIADKKDKKRSKTIVFK